MGYTPRLSVLKVGRAHQGCRIANYMNGKYIADLHLPIFHVLQANRQFTFRNKYMDYCIKDKCP